MEDTVALLIGYGMNVLGAILILILGWVAAGWIGKLVERAADRHEKFDRTLALTLARVARIGVLAFTLIAVLAQFGIQTASLVALLAAAGLAIGLSLQGALSNVAAGILLLTLRPIRVGEAVDLGGTMGMVEDIGLFLTRMRSFDGVITHVPNSNIWGSEIKNFTRSETRRVDLVFSIAYDDDMDKAIAVIKEVLELDERVLDEPAPLIAIGELSDSSVDIWARPWTKGSDLFAARLDLTKRVKERFDAEAITIPFPQRDVHIVQQTTDPTIAG